jgi:uncharacterized protein YoxC
MNTGDPQFWQMVSSIVIAVSFVFMAIALFWIAITVKGIVSTVKHLEERVDPLIAKVDAIGAQGREISVHFNEISANLSTATKYLAESTELIKEEVVELRQLVSDTAGTARDKVEMVSQTIDRTHTQVTNTTEFVNQKIVVPAREIAAIMAGVKRGLEVLFAPAPKQIDRVYTEEEVFIG